MPFYLRLRPVQSFFFCSSYSSSPCIAASLNHWIPAVRIGMSINFTSCFQQNMKIIKFFSFPFVGFSSQNTVNVLLYLSLNIKTQQIEFYIGGHHRNQRMALYKAWKCISVIRPLWFKFKEKFCTKLP